MSFSTERLTCKACSEHSIIKFISFGEMPIANAFLKKSDLNKNEFKYNMEVGFCENCKMVQLVETPPYDKYIVPDETGKTNYAFFSSTSKFMEDHFAELAREVEIKFLTDSSKVVEIGSNDGIMLKSFKNNKVLGIEPSANVAEVAQKQGIDTIVDFFTRQLASRVAGQKGKFKVALTTNVFLNIIDINDFLEGITEILEEDGVFITEDPYLMDILEKTSYDQIYDEHIWYFSLTSLSNILRKHNLEIFDAEKQWTHGGSMRVFISRVGKYRKTERLFSYLEEERNRGIESLQTYLDFARNVEKSKLELQNLVKSLKSQGKKIVGYAAASKGTIVLNYCNIGTETIDYISDSTPFKQGTYSPGKHIPIVSPEVFHEDKTVDYALLSAWNHADEIMQKEQDFVNRGGRFIVHYPEARILEPENLSPTKSQFTRITSNSLDLTSNPNNPSHSDNPKNETKEFKIKQLRTFANDQGYLYETLRADDEIFEGKFGQVVVSNLYPEVIKGLHKHKKQTDYTTCINGNIKYIAIKENPNGEPEIITKVIGENNHILVKTPPGYWHGYMPIGNKEATVLHLMDEMYDPNDDDTERLDPFHFGDIWTVKPS
ncbi:hypothetical protein COU60_00735 [Candidatus Pacearchaeota archaeon CG10_big_fil_rev_8_21_14_0_10_34_76]|nr:MAG: hypothetical protein COU60_00735 [Candidatus Pacearchaeota archaeon CG10_big_fil_rev_8_21_14_0_10_34_76]